MTEDRLLRRQETPTESIEKVDETPLLPEPVYMTLDFIPKGQALVLRYVLHEAAMGYAASNPRVKLYEKVEAEIARRWPQEALR